MNLTLGVKLKDQNIYSDFIVWNIFRSKKTLRNACNTFYSDFKLICYHKCCKNSIYRPAPLEIKSPKNLKEMENMRPNSAILGPRSPSHSTLTHEVEWATKRKPSPASPPNPDICQWRPPRWTTTAAAMTTSSRQGSSWVTR